LPRNTVDGRNPKQPPGMYKNPVNNGIFTISTDDRRISEPSTAGELEGTSKVEGANGQANWFSMNAT